MDARRMKLQQEAERRWQKLGQEHPELASTVAFGRGLVDRYINELPRAGTVTLSQDEAREKLAAGVPLLEDLQLDLDDAGISRFFFSLCGWAGAQGELTGDTRRLEQAILNEDLVVDELLAASLTGDEAAIVAVAARLDVSLTLLQSLTGFTVSAALMETARSLAPFLEGADWQDNSCPVCGGPPLLAELQGPRGRRVLRCAACGAGWPYPRTRCAHCGNEEPKTQHFITVDGQDERYRLDLCDHCQGYLKAVVTTVPTPSELLTIADAALLHLDALALERGYTPLPELDAEGVGQDDVPADERGGGETADA